MSEHAQRLYDELLRIEVGRALRPATAQDYPTVRELADWAGLSVAVTHEALSSLVRDGAVVQHAGWGLQPVFAQAAIRAAAEREHRAAIEAAHATMRSAVAGIRCRHEHPTAGRCELAGAHVLFGAPHEASGFAWGCPPPPEPPEQGPLRLRWESGRAIVETDEVELGRYVTRLVVITEWTSDGQGRPQALTECEEESEQTSEAEARAAFVALCSRVAQAQPEEA